MEYVNCNLCGLDDTIFWGEKNSIKIVKCRHCGLIYCNPRPDNDELKKFYSKEYFSEGHYEEDAQRQKMYEIEIDEIKKNIASQGRFLDVGCAVGKFLATLPDTFEKWGTEFSEDAAEIGREKFGLNIITGQIRHVELPERYYDVVQMRGVLEHSQNTFEDLLKTKKVLKDDGILRLSQLPNIDSLCGRLYKTRFNQVKPGEHLYYFSPTTINAMLVKAGFNIIKMTYPYLNTPYASPVKDCINMFGYYLKKKESPPFWGNMMIIYAQKKQNILQAN